MSYYYLTSIKISSKVSIISSSFILVTRHKEKENPNKMSSKIPVLFFKMNFGAIYYVVDLELRLYVLGNDRSYGVDSNPTYLLFF